MVLSSNDWYSQIFGTILLNLDSKFFPLMSLNSSDCVSEFLQVISNAMRIKLFPLDEIAAKEFVIGAVGLVLQIL